MLRVLKAQYWCSRLSNPTLVFHEEKVIQRHRHLMGSHCTAHSWTMIISGKTAEGENVLRWGIFMGCFIYCSWFSINVQAEKFGN